IHSFQKKEWIPMLWVKNSYNKTESFSILFGWMRLACLNGMIMNEKEEFKIKFLHKKSRFMLDVGMIIQTLQQQDVLRESRDKLYGFVHHLKNMEINPDKALALACKMLGLKFWAKKHEALEGRELYHVIRKSPDYMHFSQLFRPIAHTYFRELGYNAYALLNILTDLISHHGTEIKKLKNFSSRADYFYTLPAAEMKSFVNLAQNPGFSLENYLGKYKLIL
ncbi:MAG: DUF932 domain-containing protein, partial [Bacteroidia bacterium]|nr:DUF932 domain-containing protein [Bacteroidia bacterium]